MKPKSSNSEHIPVRRRRVLLYGTSLILDTASAGLQQYPHLETVACSSTLTMEELSALAPDVIIFDAQTSRPESALALLNVRPHLLLLGIDPSSDQLLLWSGQSSRALSMQDLVETISAASGTASPRARRATRLDQWRESVAALHTLTRRQKLALALATTGLSIVLVLLLALASPNANTPLEGTTIGGGISLETILTFAIGSTIGVATTWLWYHFQHKHSI